LRKVRLLLLKVLLLLRLLLPSVLLNTKYLY
jgi:hypothetical protein